MLGEHILETLENYLSFSINESINQSGVARTLTLRTQYLQMENIINFRFPKKLSASLQLMCWVNSIKKLHVSTYINLVFNDFS